jgi:aspartyl-tRNA(Asn)/glutamyl-tRNA(Gln) amidotransferase subunit A
VIVDRVRRALEAAEANAHLNAFMTLTADRALKRAQALESESKAGNIRGPLHGVPVAVKDNFLTAGVRTTNGSKLWADFVPSESAAAVELLEEAGAVIIGKTGMHELAYGITSTNPHYGAVRNPHDTARIPGGSSGGSGAAVAAGIVPIALGSDTGGSIRIPASFCGCVGLKATYGLLDRRGCLPLGLTLDHVGPLAATVADAESAFRAMGGKVAEPSREVRLGIPENFYFDGVDPEVDTAIRRAVAACGLALRNVPVPDVDALNAVARLILFSEAASVYDRYSDRRSDFGADVRVLLDQGALVPGKDYVTAQRLRRAFAREFLGVFREVDCLVTPTTPTTAPKIGETTIRIGDVETDVRIASTRMVRGINAIGFPAISVPCGRNSSGLPVGLQLVAKPYGEAALFTAAKAIESCAG